MGEGEGVAQAVQGRPEGDVALFELAAPALDALEHLVEGPPQLGQLGVGHVGPHGLHLLDFPRGDGLGGRRELLDEA